MNDLFFIFTLFFFLLIVLPLLLPHHGAKFLFLILDTRQGGIVTTLTLVLSFLLSKILVVLSFWKWVSYKMVRLTWISPYRRKSVRVSSASTILHSNGIIMQKWHIEDVLCISIDVDVDTNTIMACFAMGGKWVSPPPPAKVDFFFKYIFFSVATKISN